MPYSSTVSAYGDNVISQYVAVLVFSGQKNFTLKQLSLIVSSTDGPYLVVVVVQGRGGGGVEAAGTSPVTPHHIPQDLNLHQHHCEYHKSCRIICIPIHNV